MFRNAKLRATSGTTNIHQQSSPLSYHKYREFHYKKGNKKMGVNSSYSIAAEKMDMMECDRESTSVPLNLCPKSNQEAKKIQNIL